MFKRVATWRDDVEIEDLFVRYKLVIILHSLPVKSKTEASSMFCVGAVRNPVRNPVNALLY